MPKKGKRHSARPTSETLPSAAAKSTAEPSAVPPLSSLPVPPPSVVGAPDSVATVDALLTPSSALAEAMGEVLAQSSRREAAAVAPPPPPPRAPSSWIAAALASWLVALALLLFEPPIAAGPVPHAWAPAAGQAEASLRFGLWLARQRVERFEAATGRLPSFLGEAGVRDTSLHLAVQGERAFSLEGRDGALTLQLDRAMNADSFLGGRLDGPVPR